MKIERWTGVIKEEKREIGYSGYKGCVIGKEEVRSAVKCNIGGEGRQVGC